MSPAWRWWLPGYVLALPHTLVGLVLAVVYRSHGWRWSSGCLEAIGGTFERDGRTVTRIWGRPGAQTHGWLILYASERAREVVPLRAHERVHVVQAFVGGPLYALAYGACFLVLFAAQGFRDWHRAYMRSPFEVQAYGRADRKGAWQ